MKYKSLFFKISSVFLVGTLNALLIFHAPKKIKSREVYMAPPQYIDKISFGYNDVIADLLWIRYLQDMDRCEFVQPLNEKELEKSSTYVPPQPLPVGAPIGEMATQWNKNRLTSKCHLGWSYRMLDAITNLAPKFRIAYSVGAMTLSVLIEDRQGAALLYEKALKFFPNDYPIAYRAAYHYLFEIGDQERGAELLEKAGRLGAPLWVFSLAARIRTELGQALMAHQILKETIDSLPENSPYIQRLKDRLEEIENHMRSQKK